MLKTEENIAEQKMDTASLVNAAIPQERELRHSLLSFQIFFHTMVKTLRYYWHKDCGACEELKPAFKELAELKGLKYEEINVEHCKTNVCDRLEYVPTVYIGRKKLKINEMEKLLDEI